eukprot:CAMPEP_0202813340 /NCGR_PEP_ID=MMETSP1389-20130828/4722_1 /ASSEMBLY_ACC=CAM_ASM_000865 /TAXON_ID=302021 /ORGANISM="Rhodomonas sp., Strain CCMP768" /LENGTH=62 /DNA_ID=CAMNT_0049484903 /DNA_START=372 /DNA_END=560 /DNA_ORIENTATION=+
MPPSAPAPAGVFLLYDTSSNPSSSIILFLAASFSALVRSSKYCMYAFTCSSNSLAGTCLLLV